MDDMLNLVIYFVGSGLAFFVSVACVVVAVTISPLGERRYVSIARNLTALVGIILIVISATPMSEFLMSLLVVATLVWISREWVQARMTRPWMYGIRAAMLAVWLLALGLELPYHVTPTFASLGRPTLYLIGDSVSAGMRDNDEGAWPKLFAKQHGVDVHDFSKMGATVDSACKQAERIGEGKGLVLLEIGGNDLLGSTSAEQFEERLEQLLTCVCQNDRTVVMFELPLPPFANRYGLIQRRLANRFGVILIPKRHFIGVLTTPGATVDGVHLTPAGHAQMAEVVWELLQDAFAH